MNKKFLKIISLFLMLIMLCSVSVTAFAADDDELTINGGAKVSVGDRIKFTLNLADADAPIMGFELRLFYDSEYLELDTNSITFPEFDNVFYNAGLENIIPINWTDINNTVDYSSKKEFLSLEFRVIEGGETDISQYVTEMYGEDMTYLKSYTWTYSISVNDNDVVTDQTPVIYADSDTLANHTGGIVNYLDGMGEENSPNKDDHEIYEAQKNYIHNYTQVVTDIIDETRLVSGSDGSQFPWVIVIVCVGVLIVAAAVVAILIVKKKDKSASKSDSNITTTEEADKKTIKDDNVNYFDEFLNQNTDNE